MDFLVVFVLCAFTGTVFGDNASSKPRSCSDVRQFYSSKGFSLNGAPQSEISGEHLRVCPQGYTCCTSEMEENLSNLSRRELEGQVKESGRTLQGALNSQYKSFDGYVLELLNRSETTLQDSFQKTFGLLYLQNARVFQELYTELRRYYRGSNVNLEEALNDFWARLLERLFKASNPEYTFGDDYLECVAKQSETLRPFGEMPRDFKAKVTLTFMAARSFVQGLVISGEAVRKVSQVPLSPECVRAIMKLSYCPQCRGMASAKPCANYCRNVMKGCLANQADLDTEWRNLADAMLQVMDRLSTRYSMDVVILNMPLRISDAVMYMQDNLASFNSKVFQACGNPREGGTRSTGSEENTKKSKVVTEESTDNTTPGARLEKLASDVSRMIRGMQQYWVQLPSKLCTEREASQPADEDKCWNGMTIARYLPEVMGDGLASQINNPEVEIDITKPDMTIRQQIMQLKIMTNRLRNAINGNDVDFQDTSDDVSGSGSGSCADDSCPREPRVNIINEDRTVINAYPPENKRVVKGTANQNLPSFALYLLLLVTLLLRR
ncbi:glypican-1b [Chanos chanos]|uniref:Glypican-1 n=1 Tax=Chanos chanos TaxID=29144 RepID=A0A6J2VHE2_CHACN|nr:glypican-1 [Chanos chanos]